MGIKGSFTFISFPWQSKSVRLKRLFRLQFCCHNAGQDKGKKKKKKETHSKNSAIIQLYSNDDDRN